MNFPLNLVIGSLEIESHLIFEILAYSLGFQYYLKLRKKEPDPINDADRLWIFIGAVLGALFASRILGMLENLDLLLANKVSFFNFVSNKTILGGLLGGLVGVEITKKFLKITTSSGDLMVYPLILGIMIGRIGCFLAGLKDGTYGIETTLPWGINFGDGISRHPTNLYEIIFLGSLWLFLVSLEKKFVLTNGSRFKLFLAMYCLFRLLVEFIKPFGTFLILTPIQIASLLGLLYYYKVFLFPTKLIEKK